jgi:hypothetical protein
MERQHHRFHKEAPVSSILGTLFSPITDVTNAIGGLLGGGSSSADSSGLDPLSLESALSEQGSAFTNINTLSSLAQSQPQSDKLLSSLIDGDDDQ